MRPKHSRGTYPLMTSRSAAGVTTTKGTHSRHPKTRQPLLSAARRCCKEGNNQGVLTNHISTNRDEPQKEGRMGTFPATVTVFGEKFGKGLSTPYNIHQTTDCTFPISHIMTARLTSRDGLKYRALITTLNSSSTF